MNQAAVFFEGLSMQSIIPQGKALSNKASGDSIPFHQILLMNQEQGNVDVDDLQLDLFIYVNQLLKEMEHTLTHLDLDTDDHESTLMAQRQTLPIDHGMWENVKPTEQSIIAALINVLKDGRLADIEDEEFYIEFSQLFPVISQEFIEQPSLINLGFNSNSHTHLVEQLPVSLQHQLSFLTTMQTLLKGNEQESQLLSKKEVEFIKLLVKDFKTEFEQVVNRPQFQSQAEIRRVEPNLLNIWGEQNRINVNRLEPTPRVEVFQDELTNNSNETVKIGLHQLQGNRVFNSINPVQGEVTSPTPHVVHADNFQKDMTDLLVRQLQITRFPNGSSEATIKLFPENLGALDIKITVERGIITAQFIAQSGAGKELLDSQMYALRTQLLNQGFQVDKLEILQQQDQSQHSHQDELARQSKQDRENPAKYEGKLNQESDESQLDFDEIIQRIDHVI